MIAAAAAAPAIAAWLPRSAPVCQSRMCSVPQHAQLAWPALKRSPALTQRYAGLRKCPPRAHDVGGLRQAVGRYRRVNAREGDLGRRETWAGTSRGNMQCTDERDQAPSRPQTGISPTTSVHTSSYRHPAAAAAAAVEACPAAQRRPGLTLPCACAACASERVAAECDTRRP